jgi:hypothetical protein
MKTILNKPKSEWWYTYKIAFAHKWFQFLIVPYFSFALSILILSIKDGSPISFIIFASCFVLALGWGLYTGYKAMWICTKAGIDYNKPWNDV